MPLAIIMKTATRDTDESLSPLWIAKRIHEGQVSAPRVSTNDPALNTVVSTNALDISEAGFDVVRWSGFRATTATGLESNHTSATNQHLGHRFQVVTTTWATIA